MSDNLRSIYNEAPKFEPKRAPNADEVKRKKADRELAAERKLRNVHKRNLRAVELRLAQTKAANVDLDRDLGLKIDELSKAVVELQMARERKIMADGLPKAPPVEIVWLENGRKKRDFVQDDLIPLVLAEIDQSEDPYAAAGRWLTAFTNAISQKMREMPDA